MSLVNGKNLSVGRLMVRGKDADKRLKYIHVGPKGTTAVAQDVVARVSLPKDSAGIVAQRIIPQADFDKISPRPEPENPRLIDLPQGEPAVTGPHFLVPQIDVLFPEPSGQTASFTCDGDLLRKLLTVACEVCNDADKTLRIRIYEDLNAIRVDTYRQPGDQEFCGVMKGMEYDGSYIPGDVPTGVVKPEKKPQRTGMPLKTSTGPEVPIDGVGET